MSNATKSGRVHERFDVARLTVGLGAPVAAMDAPTARHPAVTQRTEAATLPLPPLERPATLDAPRDAHDHHATLETTLPRRAPPLTVKPSDVVTPSRVVANPPPAAAASNVAAANASNVAAANESNAAAEPSIVVAPAIVPDPWLGRRPRSVRDVHDRARDSASVAGVIEARTLESPVVAGVVETRTIAPRRGNAAATTNEPASRASDPTLRASSERRADAVAAVRGLAPLLRPRRATTYVPPTSTSAKRLVIASVIIAIASIVFATAVIVWACSTVAKAERQRPSATSR